MNENEIVESLKAHIDSRLSEMCLGFVNGQEPLTAAIDGLRKDIDDLRGAMVDMQSAFRQFCKMVSERSDSETWEDDGEDWKNN